MLLFDGMINTNILGPDKFKIDKKSYDNILLYYIVQVTIRYIKMKNINPLYVTVNKINGYIKESHENKYLALVSTNKSIIRTKSLLDRQLLTCATMKKNI